MTLPRAVHRSVTRAGATMVTAVVIALAPPVQAQNAGQSGKWTIELYGGGSASSASSNGTPISTFPPGTAFTTGSGQPSRAVPSWYFGDGAALLNQVLTQFSTRSGATFARIVPLDSVLRNNIASRGAGGVFGARVGRALTTKLSWEMNVERGLASLGLSETAEGSLKESSDSFKAAFQGLLDSAPVTDLAVSSTLSVPEVSSRKTRLAGALKWTVLSGRWVKAYLAFGGGVVMNSGKDPEAALTGKYAFRFLGVYPMEETDRVVVSVTEPKKSAVGLVGFGLTYDVSSRLGLRADVRMWLNSAGAATTVAASPLVATLSPTGVLPSSSITSPGLQFSTQPGVRSTLSGAAAHLTTFTNSGLSRQVSFTIGIFRRF